MNSFPLWDGRRPRSVIWGVGFLPSEVPFVPQPQWAPFSQQAWNSLFAGTSAPSTDSRRVYRTRPTDDAGLVPPASGSILTIGKKKAFKTVCFVVRATSTGIDATPVLIEAIRRLREERRGQPAKNGIGDEIEIQVKRPALLTSDELWIRSLQGQIVNALAGNREGLDLYRVTFIWAGEGGTAGIVSFFQRRTPTRAWTGQFSHDSAYRSRPERQSRPSDRERIREGLKAIRNLRKGDRYQEALVALLDLIDREGERVGSLGFHELAVLLNRLGHYGYSLWVVDQALDMDPGDRYLWHQKALVLTDLGRLDEALFSLLQAESLGMSSASFFKDMAYVFRKLRRWDQALAAIDRAIELDPRRVTSYRAKARILDEQRGREKAAAYLEEILVFLREKAGSMSELYALYRELIWLHLALGNRPRAKELAKEMYEAGILNDGIDSLFQRGPGPRGLR